MICKRENDMKKKIGATKDESPAQLVDARIEELDGSGTEKSPSPS
jgi:hypothetical protein